jgi:hypothetical protein
MTPEMQFKVLRYKCRKWRDRNHSTFRAMSKQSKIDIATLHGFENGKNISAMTFLKLVAFLERNGKAK